MFIRLLYALALLVAILFFPWWLSLLLLLNLIFLVANFYEAVIVGFGFDLLYGLPDPRWWHWQFLATSICLGLVFLSGELKKHITIYR